MNIASKDLMITGVPLIELSNKREVYLVPYEGKLEKDKIAIEDQI